MKEQKNIQIKRLQSTNMCDKESYWSKSRADIQIKLRNRSNTTKKLTKSYKCHTCLNWHVTSKETKKIKMRRIIKKNNSDLKKYAFRLFEKYQAEQERYFNKIGEKYIRLNFDVPV